MSHFSNGPLNILFSIFIEFQIESFNGLLGVRCKQFTRCQFLIRKCLSSFANRNYYQILGISSNATTDQIRNAFLQMSKQHHPDISSGDHQTFTLINEAYTTLSKSTLRSEYDVGLMSGRIRHSPVRSSYNQHTTSSSRSSHWQNVAEDNQQVHYQRMYDEFYKRQHRSNLTAKQLSARNRRTIKFIILLIITSCAVHYSLIYYVYYYHSTQEPSNSLGNISNVRNHPPTRYKNMFNSKRTVDVKNGKD